MPDDDEAGLKDEGLPPLLMIEAALFSAGKPVSPEELSISTGIEPSLVTLYLKKLIQSYGRRDTALEVIKAGQKYTLRVKEQYVDRVSTLAAPEIPKRLLKTAALIAYHQPVKQADLVEMYGPRVYDHVKELMGLGLVRARKEAGTLIITTTHHFSETFGIGSVSKKKVKGHVKERALERIMKTTLEGYDKPEGAPQAGEAPQGVEEKPAEGGSDVQAEGEPRTEAPPPEDAQESPSGTPPEENGDEGGGGEGGKEGEKSKEEKGSEGECK